MLTKPGMIIPMILVMTLLAVSVASVVAAAPVSQADTVEVTCVEDYEVQNDDWLSKIAVEYYGDRMLFTAIFEATNAAAAAGGDYASLADPNAIEIGQVLCIPSAEVAQALAAGGQAVMVAAGAAEEAAGAGEAVAEDEEEAAAEEETAATAAIVISGDARLNTLAEALALTGLEESLSAPGAGPFTLLAPTDAAFDNLPGGGLAWLQANPDRLEQVLRYHLVPVSLTGDNLGAMTQVNTLLGPSLDVTTRGGVLNVGGVTLNESNLLQTANGPVYVIDTVLLPPDIRADLTAGAEEEVAAAEETGETAAEAGEAAAEEAAAGAGEMAAGAEEAAGTTEETGGLAEDLLSDLDQAGAPVEEGAGEAVAEDEEEAAAEEETAATAAIVISGDARLNTLAEALALTGLEESLSAPGAGPFTLLAPTDAAFDNLPGGGLAWLQANPDRLARVLRYHLVPVSLTGDNLGAMSQVNTLLGPSLDVTTRGGVLNVGGVPLNESNLLQTANGPVYVIDTVLLPPDIRADLMAAAEEMAAEAEEAAGTTEERAGGLAEDLLSDLDQAGAPVEEGAGEAVAEAEEETAAETEERAGGLVEGLLSDLDQAGAPVEEGAGEAVAEAEEEAAAEAEEPAPEAGQATPEAQEPAAAEAEGAAGEPAAPPARPETAGEPAGSRVVIFNFAQALAAANQSGRLQLNAPVTIFAPTSNAFALLPQAELANLAADPARLQNLLLNHLVSGAVWSADLAGTPTLNSLIGQPLDTSIEDGKYMIEDAQVLAADFRFGNVVIHLIDKVLLPEETP